MSSVNGLTNSPKIFHYHSERVFQAELSSVGSISLVKVLSFSLKQCFVPFTMLLFEGSSEMGVFRHSSNHVFGGR